MQAVRIASTIYGDLGAVADKEEGTVMSTLGNEGRVVHAWVNVRGGIRVFAVHFWHSEGWTWRNGASMETVNKQARTARHQHGPWRFQEMAK